MRWCRNIKNQSDTSLFPDTQIVTVHSERDMLCCGRVRVLAFMRDHVTETCAQSRGRQDCSIGAFS